MPHWRAVRNSYIHLSFDVSRVPETTRIVQACFGHGQDLEACRNPSPRTNLFLFLPNVPPFSLPPRPSFTQRLNDEQLKLLETKPLLEVALAEHERVRVAMEIVAKELEQREAAERAKLAPRTPPLSISAAPEPGEQSAAAAASADSLSIPAPADSDREGGGEALPQESEEGQQQQQAAVAEKTAVEEVPVETESIGVSTEPPAATEEAEVQTDVSGPPPPPGLDPRTVSEAVAMAATLASQEKDKAAREAEKRGVEKGRAEVAAGLSKVLRLLHVASRFEAKGQRLPSAVDFFSKVCTVAVLFLHVLFRRLPLPAVAGREWRVVAGVLWGVYSLKV